MVIDNIIKWKKDFLARKYVNTLLVTQTLYINLNEYIKFYENRITMETVAMVQINGCMS